MAERPVEAGRRASRRTTCSTHLGRRHQHQRAHLSPPAAGLTKVYAGAESAAFYGVPASDPRVPDIIGIVRYGVVYTGGKSKIAEHGGDAPQDRDVPILAVVPGLRNGRVISTPVETTQIAPTILSLLGLNPRDLQAVRIEGTKVLPSLGHNGGH